MDCGISSAERKTQSLPLGLRRVDPGMWEAVLSPGCGMCSVLLAGLAWQSSRPPL